jgi:hypothetical protein
MTGTSSLPPAAADDAVAIANALPHVNDHPPRQLLPTQSSGSLPANNNDLHPRAVSRVNNSIHLSAPAAASGVIAASRDTFSLEHRALTKRGREANTTINNR